MYTFVHKTHLLKSLSCCNNNNCKNSIAPKSIKYSSSRRNKQNHLISHTRGQANVVIGAWNRLNSKAEKQFQKMFSISYESCI